jgi:hypothetical protein
MKTFYLIPECALIERNLVGSDKRKNLYISSIIDDWYSQYKFDYDNIDKERLLNMILVTQTV